MLTKKPLLTDKVKQGHGHYIVLYCIPHVPVSFPQSKLKNEHKTVTGTLTMNESQLHLVLEYNEEYSKLLWPSTLYSLLCLVIGLFGNGYVLVIYKFKMKDETESRYFIPYLAIADACTSLFTCIIYTVHNFHMLYFPWDFLCKSLNVLSFIPGITSVLFLLAIAVQRFMRSRPSGRHFSLFWRRATLVIILTVSVCFGVPSFLFAGVGEIQFVYNGVNISSINCQTRNDQYPIFENVYYGVMALFASVNIVSIFILYICIAVVVYRWNSKTKLNIIKSAAMSGKEDTENTEHIELDCIEPLTRNITRTNPTDDKDEDISPNDGSNKTASPSTQFNKMFVTIVVAYVLTYLPTGVIMITLISNKDTDSTALLLSFPVWKLQIYIICERTVIINNIVNPFIYGYFDMEFRKYLKKLLPPFCRRKV